MVAAEGPISIRVGLSLDAVCNVVDCLIGHALSPQTSVESKISAISIIVAVVECAQLIGPVK
jgi:hypothetical protein